MYLYTIFVCAECIHPSNSYHCSLCRFDISSGHITQYISFSYFLLFYSNILKFEWMKQKSASAEDSKKTKKWIFICFAYRNLYWNIAVMCSMLMFTGIELQNTLEPKNYLCVNGFINKWFWFGVWFFSCYYWSNFVSSVDKRKKN